MMEYITDGDPSLLRLVNVSEKVRKAITSMLMEKVHLYRGSIQISLICNVAPAWEFSVADNEKRWVVLVAAFCVSGDKEARKILSFVPMLYKKLGGHADADTEDPRVRYEAVALAPEKACRSISLQGLEEKDDDALRSAVSILFDQAWEARLNALCYTNEQHPAGTIRH